MTSLAIAATGCAPLTMTHGIPSLHHVSPGIWVGGQPTEAGWLWLAGHGIIRDIKCNTWGGASDSEAHELGMEICYHPIGLMDQLCLRPNDDEIRRAVDEMRGGTFLHCEKGQDRSRLVLACFRLRQGWTKAKAEKEMMDGGFHIALQGLYGYWLKQKPEDWKQ
jgi:hypothetical protein